MSTLRCTKCVIKEPSSSPWGHRPLPTPPSLSPIPQVHNRAAADSIVVPELSFEDIHQVKYYLPFGLLTLYFAWWRLALVTVGRSSLQKLLKNSWGVNLIPRDFTSNIQSFGSSLICDVCDIDNTGTRALKLATKWKTTYLFVCWLSFFSGDVFHLWLLGALVYLTLFGIYAGEISWGVHWIWRDTLCWSKV